MAASLLFAACFLVGSAAAADVESALKSRLITTVNSFPCVRLLKAGGDIGCSSGSDGVTGHLFLIESAADLGSFRSLPADTVMRTAVLSANLLTLATINVLRALPYFAGIIVLPDPVPSSGYSPDAVNLPYLSPTSALSSSISSAAPYPWNPTGQGLMYERFPFPIITVNSQDGQWIRTMALQNLNRGAYLSFPQYAVHMYYYMGPNGLDSYSCLDAGSCLPLGGQSVWATMGPLDAADSPIITPSSASSRQLSAETEEGEEEDGQTERGGGVQIRIRDATRQQQQQQLYTDPRPHASDAIQRANRKFAMHAAARLAQDKAREDSNNNNKASSSAVMVEANVKAADGEIFASTSGSSADHRSLASSSSLASSLPVRNKPQRPVVMAVTAMDSSALFHDLAFGGDSAASGLVALLAAADALSRSSVPVYNLPRQILFGVFQGESWGRIGSRRWVSEVQGTFRCLSNVTADNSPSGRAFCASPLRTDLGFTSLRLEDIVSVIAVDQVGTPGISSAAGNTFYLHEFDSTPSPPSSPGMNTVRNATSVIFNTLSAAVGAAGIPIPVVKASNSDRSPVNIPPCPLMSFQEAILAGNPPGAGFDGAVLAGYDRAYTAKYYHSRYDYGGNLGLNTTLTAIDANVVTAAATALAKGLFAMASLGNATGLTPSQAAAQVPSDLAANASLVTQLINCITVNARCSLFSLVLGMDDASLANLVPDGPLSLYTSVYNQPYALYSNGGSGGSTTSGYVLQPTPLEAVVRNLLGRFSALPSQTKLLPSPTPTPKGRMLAPGGNPTGILGTTCTTKQCQDTFGKAYECLLGACVVANSFYHDALSPALAASTTNYGSYSALTGGGVALGTSGNTAGGQPQPPAWVLDLQADPLWTEPYWSANIGATAFLKDSPKTDAIMLGMGITVTLLSIVGSFYLIRWLDKHYKVP